MHSLDGANGMLRLTTNKPCFEIEATLSYLLTSRSLVRFFMGEFPGANERLYVGDRSTQIG